MLLPMFFKFLACSRSRELQAAVVTHSMPIYNCLPAEGHAAGPGIAPRQQQSDIDRLALNQRLDHAPIDAEGAVEPACFDRTFRRIEVVVKPGLIEADDDDLRQRARRDSMQHRIDVIEPKGCTAGVIESARLTVKEHRAHLHHPRRAERNHLRPARFDRHDLIGDDRWREFRLIHDRRIVVHLQRDHRRKRYRFAGIEQKTA